MVPWTDASRGERQAAIHEEIDRLPGFIATVVVLCGLEGRPIEQAARDLRWPVGALERRLARAVDRLRVRLSRSYYGIPAGIGDSDILPDVGVTVPESLIESTVAAATRRLVPPGGSRSREWSIAESARKVSRHRLEEAQEGTKKKAGRTDMSTDESRQV